MLGFLRSLENNGVNMMRQILRQALPTYPAFLPATLR